jgi:hypothetical protein
MTEQIIDGTQIETAFQQLSFSAPRPNPGGGKVVNMFDSRFKESLIISTPLMLCWGAQEGKENNSDKPNGKWTMSLQFPSEEYKTDEEMAFLESMKKLEHHIKEVAVANSKLWFGKEIKSLDIIEEKFNPMLKYPKVAPGSAELDYSRPPTMTVKIPKWKTGWKSEIYDEDGEPIYIPDSLTNDKVKEMNPSDIEEAIKQLNDGHTPIEYLPKQSRVICLLQCGGLWFVNGKASITWNLQQAVVKKPKQSTKGVCFIKPRPSEVEALKSMPHPEKEDADADEDEHVSTLVEDSDEEDNDDVKVSGNDDESHQEELNDVEITLEPTSVEPTPIEQPKKPRKNAKK